jgi:hypothetical protein
MSIALCVYYLLTFLTDTDLLTLFQDLVAQPDALFTFIAVIGNVRNIDGSFLLDDAALALGIGTLMALDKVELFHNHPVFVPHNPDDLAGFAFFPAGRNLHRISLFQVLSLHFADPYRYSPPPVTEPPVPEK